MALTSITAEVRGVGGGTATDSAAAATQTATLGSGVIPAISSSWTFGTGNAQVNKWHLARRTLAATTFDNINLTSGLSTLGAVQAVTALKFLLVAIVSPDGTKKLRIGPQAQANANILWFQAATANFWEETFTYIVKERPITGWAVAPASTDILSIYNPGASSLDYAIWVMGTG